MNSCMKWFGIALLPVFVTLANAGETYLVRLKNPDKALVTRFLREGRDVAAYVPGKLVDLVASESEYKSLAADYRSVSVLSTASEIQARLSRCRGYQTYEQMLEKLQSFEKTYPQLCKLYDIGDSRGKEYNGTDFKAYDGYKHEIWAMKLTGNITQAADKPKFYFVGEHHAREPASTEVCMGILENFLTNYASDAAVAERVNNCEIWFVPLVNPNGHKFALTGDEIHKLWRKNIRDNNNDRQITIDNQGWGGEGDGVDLNRNYDYKWGTTGVDMDPNELTYPGPTPGSEPEIKAVTTLLNENMFVAGISYHLYIEMVLWPYGYEEEKFAPDSAALGDLGRKIAGKLPTLDGKTYTPDKSSGLYPCSGTTDDYAYATRGTFAYTIELFNNDFYPDDAAVEKLKKDNVGAAMELLGRVKYSTLSGTVTSGGKTPVEAEVYVKEVDDTVATKTAWRGAYMTDKAYGRYYRLLMPGTYTVTFRPKNPTYRDTTIAGVKITNDKVTALSIAYGGTSVLTMNGPAPDSRGIYMERAANGLVRIALSQGEELERISVFSAGGALIGELGPSSARARNVAELDTRGMARGLYIVQVKGAKRSGTVRLAVAR